MKSSSGIQDSQHLTSNVKPQFHLKIKPTAILSAYKIKLNVFSLPYSKLTCIYYIYTYTLSYTYLNQSQIFETLSNYFHSSFSNYQSTLQDVTWNRKEKKVTLSKFIQGSLSCGTVSLTNTLTGTKV